MPARQRKYNTSSSPRLSSSARMSALCVLFQVLRALVGALRNFLGGEEALAFAAPFAALFRDQALRAWSFTTLMMMTIQECNCNLGCLLAFLSCACRVHVSQLFCLPLLCHRNRNVLVFLCCVQTCAILFLVIAASIGRWIGNLFFGKGHNKVQGHKVTHGSSPL